MRGEECTRFLRLCEIPESEFSAFASDYERFCAVADALPLAAGFPFAEIVRSFLKSELQVDCELTRETCDNLWKALAEGKREVFRNGDSAKPSNPKKLSFSSPISAFAILENVPQDPTDFNGYIFRETESADVVFATLPSDYSFVEPNPFSVGRELQKRENENLLLTQLLRQICVENICPIVLVAANSEECLSLLEYLRKSGQKNEIFCVSDDRNVQKEIARYRAGRTDRLIHNAYRADSFLSSESLAKICPIGAVYQL